jgi:hypothetical protein
MARIYHFYDMFTPKSLRGTMDEFFLFDGVRDDRVFDGAGGHDLTQRPAVLRAACRRPPASIWH